MANFSLAQDTKPVDFQREVRPILSQYCFQCHGPDEQTREAELRLDSESGLRKVVQAGEEKSKLLHRIRAKDLDLRMPPPATKKSLKPAELRILERWVAQGAPFDQHWAYVPPKRTPFPTVRNRAWVRNWLDQFLLSRLERENVAPSPEADKRVLLRRVAFDLTGLPPSPEFAAHYLADTRPDAYEKLVDELLQSPAFGERLASYWLDLVRFADTVGYHGDKDHNISPYRDYVIDAFNENVRFDRFTREQLAGDLLPGSTIDQKIATGYNRMLQTSHEGGVQAKEYLAIYAADRVRNVSAVWLGGTLGCAQCHDHKYDPYSTKDFYSIAAFFADVDESKHFSKGGNSLPTNRPPEPPLLTRREREQINILEAQIKSGLEDGMEPGRLIELKQRKSQLQSSARRTMITVSISPRAMRVLPRGNWLDDSGPVVQPAVPEFLGRINGKDRATRLDLANWFVDPKGGAGLLTARVMANRFWYLFFGDGLSTSLDDFGGQGMAPDHPELLDALAHAFVDSGWDIKQLVRLMVTSSAYRQSSQPRQDLIERDPKNRLFARQGSWRLSAEMVRDNALAVGGLLVGGLGGPSVKPYQPAGYYRHLNFPKRKYTHDTDERQWRRAVYVHWQRQFVHPMMRAFDAPSREECAAKRARSNTPLAALVLLNDPTFIEAAKSLADRALRDSEASTKDRIDFMFRRALTRSASAEEVQILSKYQQSSLVRYQKSPQSVEELLGVGMHSLASAKSAEFASWVNVARVLLNTSESMSRN